MTAVQVMHVDLMLVLYVLYSRVMGGGGWVGVLQSRVGELGHVCICGIKFYTSTKYICMQCSKRCMQKCMWSAGVYICAELGGGPRENSSF